MKKIVMPQYKACLFDLNGTLVDSYGPETDLMVEVANRHSHGGLPFTAGDFNDYGGRKIAELFIGVMRKKGVEKCEQAGRAASSEFFARYDEILGKMKLINPCTNKVAASLSASGIKTGIVSSAEKPLLEKVLEYFGFAGNFDFIIGRDSEMEKSAVYLNALSKLEVEPEEAVAVEDTERGIRAARAAGIGTVYGMRRDANVSELGDADRVIDSVNELLPLLLEG